MAEIQIVYWGEPYCDSGFRSEYCDGQCLSDAAEDLGCRGFEKTSEFNYSCKHVHVDLKYKGLSVKNYEMELAEEDPFFPGRRLMYVTIGKKIYECVKVVLDGKCIFRNRFVKLEGEENVEQETT